MLRVSEVHAVGWCTFVCPSVCLFVYCIQMAKDIVKLLSRSGSHHPIPSEPLSGGVKYTGWEKMRFSTEIAVYLGNGTR